MNANTSIEATLAEQKLFEILSSATTTTQQTPSTSKSSTTTQTTNFPNDNLKDFQKWFLNYFQNKNDCALENFAIYFLNAVRQYTFHHLRTNDINEKMSAMTLKNNDGGDNEQQQQQHNKTSTPFKTTENLGKNLMRNSSTPIRRDGGNGRGGGGGNGNTAGSSSKNNSQNQRRSTDRHNHSTISNNSSRNSTSDGSFCLGDFIVSSPNYNNRQQSGNGSHKKKIQSQSLTTTTTTSSTTTSKSNTKPKKRVVPITIAKTTALTSLSSLDIVDNNTSNNSPFGIHSRSFNSFDNNNIFTNSTTTELKDFNKSSIAEARKALKKDLNEVNIALKTAAAASTTTTTPTKNSTTTATMISENLTSPTFETQISFDNFSLNLRQQLKLLANIYALLMDMNFIINILSEFSFLLNLLNANIIKTENVENEDHKNDKNGLKLLRQSLNSIYFALSVLEMQHENLILIDMKSLNVILQYERIEYLSPILKMKLNAAYEQKQSLASNMEYQNFSTGAGVGISGSIGCLSNFKNVCFQEDSDSRKFFPTANEFGAFKTQRDHFYNVLKIWEKNHLNPSWNFGQEISIKVRDIFKQSEHPINMLHFAKLFVSQLLISLCDKKLPEDIGFGNEIDVDLQKFNKLTQRLITPSNFSVDYQFPREQAFFRDFIIESHSLPFIEQLKMIIFSELIKLNETSYETIINNDDDIDDDVVENYNELNNIKNNNEFIIEPFILSSMITLAKFLGFILSLPYQNGGNSNGNGGGGSNNNNTISQNNDTINNNMLLQSQQLKLRKLFNEPFDISELLNKAIINGKHLITIPWLVQYMAMLDDITLQMDTNIKTLKIMFEFYANYEQQQKQMLSISNFIIRCCLGWLFEQKTNIANDYYNYRITIFKMNAMNETKKINNKLKSQKPKLLKTQTNANANTNALLEMFLNVACPYLADFRVSIMPAKYALTKYVSRTGRYRHITPCFTELPKINNEIKITTSTTLSSSSLTTTKTTEQQNINSETQNQQQQPTLILNDNQQRQRKLMESFLHSQNNSMRRLLIFLSERTYKCVIKDAQQQILLPSKISADNLINEINEINYDDVFTKVQQIYRNAKIETLEKWNSEIPNILKKRIIQSLDALLPLETSKIIKQTYAWRIESDANIKIEQWRYINLFKNDFYCNDIQELTEKLCKANINKIKQGTTTTLSSTTTQSTELKIIKAKPSLSDLLEEMQIWMHTTSGNSKFQPQQYPTNLNIKTIDEALINYLKRLQDSFENVLPTIYYRLIGSGLIQIILHFITNCPNNLTKNLIKEICQFFMNENMRNADESITTTTTTNNLNNKKEEIKNIPVTSMYNSLITPTFIESLNAKRLCFDKLKELLLSMIEIGLISIDYINELFISIFKQELNSKSFNEISRILKELLHEINYHKKNTDNNDDDIEKSKLFMEVLADFSRDADYL